MLENLKVFKNQLKTFRYIFFLFKHYRKIFLSNFGYLFAKAWTI